MKLNPRYITLGAAIATILITVLGFFDELLSLGIILPVIVSIIGGLTAAALFYSFLQSKDPSLFDKSQDYSRKAIDELRKSKFILEELNECAEILQKTIKTKEPTALRNRIEELINQLPIGNLMIRPIRLDKETIENEGVIEAFIFNVQENLSYVDSQLQSLGVAQFERQDVDETISFLQGKTEELKQRLIQEIAHLSRRADVYLVIGSFITCFAAGYIIYTVEAFTGLNSTTIRLSGPMDVFKYVYPLGTRISLALFVQLFAYFFLKLHRANSQSIIFYHNEITNIENMSLALYTAVLKSNREALLHTLEKLSQTERNFILNKGQTTIGLERDKILNYVENKLLDRFSAIIEKLKASESSAKASA